MKARGGIWWMAAALLLALVSAGGAAGAEVGTASMAQVFSNPPAAARPQVWWHWMNGHVSRPGITKDLEAIAAAGLGGVTLFEEADRIPEGPVRYASAEHFALIRFAAAECARLGLEFGFHNGPGWSASGGPWITPEHAMKHLTWSEATVRGPGRQTLRLPRPPTHVAAWRPVPHHYANHDYYRDVAVIAFPTPREPTARLEDWPVKAGFLARYDLREQEKAMPSGGVIKRADIRVLPGVVTPDGELAWDVPPGEWTVLRLGAMLTGKLNQQAPTTGGRGLDCDKLSREALDAHWESFVARAIAAARADGGAALSTVVIDSYETEGQTWTPRMAEEFRRLRGYDLLPLLPCLTGRVIGSVEETERFLWDYRRTIADLVKENYYGYFAARCRALGLKASFEGYGYNGIFDDFAVSRLADVPMAEFWAGIYKYSHWGAKVAASAADLTGRHVVAAEAFTAGGDSAAWRWHPFTLKAQGDAYLAQGVTRFHFQASAHQPWSDAVRPGMTMGPHGIQMNRHNTWWPQARAWFAYLGRTQAMLQQGQLTADVCYYYGENSPATLRTKPHATNDRLGLPWDPDADMSPDLWQRMPEGHDFHVCNDQVLAEFSVNARGQIVHPHGARYEVLVLPNDTRMRAATLRTLAALIEAGATLLGPKPRRSPSLAERGENDGVIRELADRVWGDIDGRMVTAHGFGRGRVFFGVSLADVLRERGIGHDVEYRPLDPAATPAPRLAWQHRRVGDADFYFVSNQRNTATAVRVQFRLAGRVPEIWHPETGTTGAAPLWQPTPDGRTEVTLLLGPAESCFVLFPPARDGVNSAMIASLSHNGRPVTDHVVARLEPRSAGTELVAFASGDYSVTRHDTTVRTATVASVPAPLDLSAGWSAEFPTARERKAVNFDRLASWTQQDADSIRHFSGTATYTREFFLDAGALPAGAVADLDLGNVQVIAELEVNGSNLGVLWRPPFRCDVTAALHPGVNRLVVRVTNLWRNRLIGDARLAGYTKAESRKLTVLEPFPPVPEWVATGAPHPDPRRSTFTTNRFLTAEDTLSPSGLLGPVRLILGERVSLP